MTTRTQKERLKERHRDLIGQMLRSIDAYEDGYGDEGRRLALAIRTLVHDTGKQTSLLTHLGLKTQMTFYDTASEIDPRQCGSHLALLALVFPLDGSQTGPTRIEARLDQQPTSPKDEMQSFDVWWNTSVICDDRGRTFSRRDIVLFLANQDGGAHVDLKVDPSYLRIVSGEATEWRALSETSSGEFVEGIELATARQVAHELLVTLARHEPDSFADPATAARYANQPIERSDDAASITDLRVYADAAKLGRNDPCWCGSEKKYKKCHASPKALLRNKNGKRCWDSLGE